jgi:hypothetical protein
MLFSIVLCGHPSRRAIARISRVNAIAFIPGMKMPVEARLSGGDIGHGDRNAVEHASSPY